MAASHAGWSGMRLWLASVTRFDPEQKDLRPVGGTYFSQKSSENNFCQAVEFHLSCIKSTD